MHFSNIDISEIKATQKDNYNFSRVKDLDEDERIQNFESLDWFIKTVLLW